MGKTGYKYITIVKKTGKYQVMIPADNKQVYLGCYEHIEDAIEARDKGIKLDNKVGTRGPESLNLKGKKFGKLFVIERVNNRPDDYHSFWLCECECGNRKVVQGSALTNKYGTRSCGCLKEGPKKGTTLKRWTADEESQLLNMRTQGKEFDEIAKKLNRGTHAVVKRYHSIKNKTYKGEIKMKAVIEYKKNHEHIVGGEWKEEYDLEFQEDTAKQTVIQAIDDHKEWREGEMEFPEDEQDLLNLKEGIYALDVGDFTCYVEIGGKEE